jgi:hypothetical protein
MNVPGTPQQHDPEEQHGSDVVLMCVVTPGWKLDGTRRAPASGAFATTRAAERIGDLRHRHGARRWTEHSRPSATNAP